MKEEKREKIIVKTTEMIEAKKSILKAETIKNMVERDCDLKVTNALVRQVFREDLGLKYKKIKRLPYTGNSERNLILRQQFAMKLLELL